MRVYANETNLFAKLLLHIQHTIDALTCSAKEIAGIKSHIKKILAKLSSHPSKPQ